jgi:hypothetical protein
MLFIDYHQFADKRRCLLHKKWANVLNKFDSRGAKGDIPPLCEVIGLAFLLCFNSKHGR